MAAPCATVSMMAVPANQLHCFIPGLLGPFGSSRAEGANPQAPHLERLLTRADRSVAPGRDYLSALYTAFGLPADDVVPSAALCRLAEGFEPGQAYWLHADPVYLRADMSRLLLFDSRSLDMEQDEAWNLGELINRHFAQDGWRLEPVAPDRWYLRLPESPRVRFHPLQDVAGRSIHAFLPSGEEASRWHGYLNELQMLLFHADANEQRRNQGRPEVSGVWLWGGGALPVAADCDWTRVRADYPFVRGLAKLHQVPTISADAPDPAQGKELIFKPDLLPAVRDGDIAAWSTAIQQLEPWLESLGRELRSKQLGRLILYPCNGHSYRLTAKTLRRFWRRSKPLNRLLQEHIAP